MDDTREIVLSNGRVAIVDAADFDWLSEWRWHYRCARGEEYAYRANGPGRTLDMHRAILGCGPGEECDHINGDGLRNLRSNLRKCTHQQNQCNQKKHRDGTSAYKGVSWYPRDHKWRAVAGHKFLGFFESEIDAARVYNAAAARMFGEFARLNDLRQEAPHASQ